MRKPLRWYHEAWREIVCWLLGHDWTFCWRRVRDTEPPGWTKRSMGNPYFANVASWSAKCRRCRTRTTSEPHYPLWQQVGSMIRQAASVWWISVGCYSPWPKRVEGHGYGVTPVWVWLTHALIGSPLFAFEQVWFGWFAHEWHFPGFVGIPAAEIGTRLSWWAQGKTTYFRWKPPQDPTDKNEIGFWVREQDAKHTEETGEWLTRVWCYTGEAA